MSKSDSGWQDWEKADSYKSDDDWGSRAKSEAKWKAWEQKALEDGEDSRDKSDSPASDSAARRNRNLDQSWQAAYREAGPFLDIGLNLAVTIVTALVVFLGGGSWLDKRFELEPILTIVGALLAFIAIFYRFYAGVQRLTQIESAKKKKSQRRRD